MALKTKEKSKSIFETFCLDSSILGLKYFYLYPNTLSRLYWGLVMAGVTIFSCLLTYALYMRFEAMPTRIAIENQHALAYNLPFPAVTICSPNQITITATEHFNRTLIDGNRTSNLQYLVKQLLGFYEITGLDQKGLHELQNLLDLNRYMVPEVMTILPQRCDQFLKVCYFHLKRYDNCKGLFNPILTHHGYCCIFNSMYSFKSLRNEVHHDFKYFQVEITGLSHGLTVITDFQPEDGVNETIRNAGASRVMLTSWNEFPADDQFARVISGAEAFFPTVATHTYCSEDVKELPWHTRKCYFEHEHRLPFFNHYHNSDCDLLCFVQAVEDVCHCQLFYLPRLRLSRTCNVTSIICIRDLKLNMNRLSLTENCGCPRDCDSLEYKAEMAIGNLDALPYVNHNLFDGIVFNKSTTILHFFFPGPVYTRQKQETVMSLTTLASNLGGVFGLCIGCSVISAVEILFYIYISLRDKIKKKIQKTVLKREKNSRIAYLN